MVKAKNSKKYLSHMHNVYLKALNVCEDDLKKMNSLLLINKINVNDLPINNLYNSCAKELGVLEKFKYSNIYEIRSTINFIKCVNDEKEKIESELKIKNINKLKRNINKILKGL